MKLTQRPRLGKVKSLGPKYPKPVEFGVDKQTVDLITEEDSNVSVDLSTADSGSKGVDLTPPPPQTDTGGFSRRNFTNQVSTCD